MTKLTKTIVEQYVPGERDQYVWDELLPGFGLKVTPAGKKIYLVQYRPKGQTKITRRYTIGRHSAPWTTEAARKAATELLARVRLGEDPFDIDKKQRANEAEAVAAHKAGVAAAERERFSLLVAEFIRRHAKMRNKRWDEAQRILTSADMATLLNRPVSAVSKRDIVELIERVEKRSHGAARLAFAHLRKFFAWCTERLIIEQSPFVGLKAPATSRARDRVLNDTELTLVLAASATLAIPFRYFFPFLLFTAQRREEVASLEWSELDLKKREWTIPAARAKNSQAHVVDLSDGAIKILTELQSLRAIPKRPTESPSADPQKSNVSEYVFTSNGIAPISGFSQAKQKLDASIEVIWRTTHPEWPQDRVVFAPWRVHDLRRTAATGMARLGHQPHVVEAVLNHRSGVRGGLVAIYQHYDHRKERLRALTEWGIHVNSLTPSDSSK